ncbi:MULTISPECIES: ASCH domain-containing protein [Pseudomonas]|uniref:ASCH domain-containing protein n=1 Tax=Pseudomonas TaxID=286 RepID=UPI001EF0AF83|nr:MULTISPECIES: ASCH domain-containing protein [Pseudomonas]
MACLQLHVIPFEKAVQSYADFQERSIKALSIVRPSGGRIASGEKTLEVRRWHPDLDPAEDLLIVENKRFLHAEGDEDADGIAVAIVRVKVVRPFVLADMEAACASYFEEGWLAWELSHVRPVAHPAIVRAARGIYEVDFLLPGKY